MKEQPFNDKYDMTEYTFLGVAFSEAKYLWVAFFHRPIRMNSPFCETKYEVIALSEAKYEQPFQLGKSDKPRQDI